MGRHTLNGNPPIDVSLRRSRRAKRLSLRVSRLDGRVTLTLPHLAAEREGISFLRAKEAWLRSHLDQLAPVQTVAIGEQIMLRGKMTPIVAGEGKRLVIADQQIAAPGPEGLGLKIKAQLRQIARNALVEASDRYAGLLGQSYTRISIRDTRSRWGSCSSQGALMYSWRLIMAPPSVLDYVAAHEVAHLVEMNHSAAFWAVVEKICPGYKAERDWLRQHGDRLHRVNFDN
ncbi:SprT family zinc-dependent metalloprotease [Yoonia sp. BS5-3]|uniref:M48 family metallopeptidase n=1 Tax=Yoonia phaeophyticola TaxID=3137369 RepID=A0ABZ2V448_9RHOB